MKNIWAVFVAMAVLVLSASFTYADEALNVRLFWVVETEVYGPGNKVIRSGWEVPQGAKIISEETMIRSYDRVRVGTRNKTNIYYGPMFDPFAGNIRMVPKMHSEEVPDYIEEPVYATRYTYEVPEQVLIRTDRVEGDSWPVRFPSKSPSTVEKRGLVRVSYWVSLTPPSDPTVVHTFKVSEEFWKAAKFGSDGLTVDRAGMGKLKVSVPGRSIASVIVQIPDGTAKAGSQNNS